MCAIPLRVLFLVLLTAGCGQAQQPGAAKTAPRRANTAGAKVQKPAKPARPSFPKGQALVTSVGDTLNGSRFVVPQVRLPQPTVAARINLALTDAALGEDLEYLPEPFTAQAGIKQAQAEYDAKQQSGFVGAHYEVLYNDQYLLSVAFTADYMGAYPSSSTRHATFDLRTGQQLEVRDMVADTAALRQRWQESINRRVANHLSTLPKEYPEVDADMLGELQRRLYWNDTTRTVQLEAGDPRLYDFALTPFGIVLYYDFGFPHVIEALQPDTEYLFPYAELKAWLKPKGPLAFRR